MGTVLGWVQLWDWCSSGLGIALGWVQLWGGYSSGLGTAPRWIQLWVGTASGWVQLWGGYSSVAEHLSSLGETLDLIPRIARRKKKGWES